MVALPPFPAVAGPGVEAAPPVPPEPIDIVYVTEFPIGVVPVLNPPAPPPPAPRCGE